MVLKFGGPLRSQNATLGHVGIDSPLRLFDGPNEDLGDLRNGGAGLGQYGRCGASVVAVLTNSPPFAAFSLMASSLPQSSRQCSLKYLLV